MIPVEPEIPISNVDFIQEIVDRRIAQISHLKEDAVVRLLQRGVQLKDIEFVDSPYQGVTTIRDKNNHNIFEIVEVFHNV